MIEYKSNARRIMRENAPKVFFISIVFIALTTIMSEFQFRLPGTVAAYDKYLEQLSIGNLPDLSAIYRLFRPSGIPLAILLWLLSSILDVGFISYCMKITRQDKGEYTDLFDGFLYLGRILAIKLLTTIMTFLWSCLFFFPGIAAHYRYRQAYYILLDDPKKTVMQCIRESKRIMHRHKLDLFLLDLSFILWTALDIMVVMLLPFPFAVPLISIWLTPYRGISNVAFYNKLVLSVTV